MTDIAALQSDIMAQISGAADEADLDQWQRFEADHPETFVGMYNFTVCKTAP